MKGKIYLIPFFVVLLVHFLTSCGTGSTSSRRGSREEQKESLSERDVTITVQYLTRKLLYRRFGTKDNPFFEYQSNSLIIIDFTATSRAAVLIRLSKIGLDFLGEENRPLSRVEVNDYWQTLLRKHSGVSPGIPPQYRGWSYNRISKKVESSVIPDLLRMDPQTEYRGLLLFIAVRNRRGTAKLRIPVYDEIGELFHEYTFDIYVL